MTISSKRTEYIRIRLTADERRMLEELVETYQGNLTMSDILRAGLYHIYYEPDCKLRSEQLRINILAAQKGDHQK